MSPDAAPSRIEHGLLSAGVFAILLSTGPFAVLAGSRVQALTRGRNVSDVGVSMYPHGGLAALLSMAAALGLCGIVLWSIYRFVPGRRALLAWFGIPWLVACNAVLALLVALGA